VPTANDFEHDGHKLIIFEDLYDEVCENLSMSKFFTFLSRLYLLDKPLNFNSINLASYALFAFENNKN